MKFLLLLLLLPLSLTAQKRGKQPDVAALATAIEPKTIEWRRDFHEHPELSNREFRTAAIVAEHLQKLGLEVQTEVAHTGVVGILRGGKPGPVVALRADMDALPVRERVDLPFASKAMSLYNGDSVPVMHACGHDTHVAILMSVAEILSQMQPQLQGTVKFIFQPAEEGAPKGEEGGAELMVKQGVLQAPEVDVIFGLHISADKEVGTIHYRPGGTMASVDDFQIVVKGAQTHGSQPWGGTDPIVTSAQIINNLQTIVSRNMPLTRAAAVVTVGKITAGNRSNIIPEQAEMIGTIRALDEQMREQLHQRIREVATKTAEAMGATAEVAIPYSVTYPVTYNNPALVERMLPSLRKAAGASKVQLVDATTGAEDFSFFAREVPGFFFFLGGRPADISASAAAPHHTPDFYIDESGMKLGVQALVQITLDYMAGN